MAKMLITGANTGLGFETALKLSKLGHEVILACRNQKKGENAIKKIKNHYPSTPLAIYPLDLSSFESIKTFAKLFSSQHRHLDILVNNAGVMIPPFTLSQEHYELQFAVNYLGHFLLSSLLQPVLEASVSTPKIISLASLAHRKASIDFDSFKGTKKYKPFKYYAQSKLACLMFALTLDRKLKARHSKVQSIAAHPGVSVTELGRHIPKWLYFTLGMLVKYLAPNKPHQACKSIVEAVTSDKTTGGEYFGPQQFGEVLGKVGKAKIYPNAKDIRIQEKLWTVSEAIIEKPFFA